MLSRTFLTFFFFSLLVIVAMGSPASELKSRAGSSMPDPLFTSCTGGSVKEKCMPALNIAWRNRAIQPVTTEHKFFTLGACKLTTWTDGEVMDLPGQEVLESALQSMDEACTPSVTPSVNGTQARRGAVFVGKPTGNNYMVFQADLV